MKKQHRIISLLLVLSMLFGSLVFTVSADTAVASSGDAFVPTATLTDITPTGTSTWVGSQDAYVLNGSDPDLGSASWTLSNQDFTAHKVTLPNGNTYFQLTGIKSGDTTTHTHFTPYGKTNVTYDANSNNYVVYEMDIGTESTIQDFVIGMIVRAGGTGGTWMSSGWTNFSSALKVNAGEFKHITVVQDFNNNKAYVFSGDTLVATPTLMSASGFTSFTGGQDAATGIRIQADSSYKVTPVVENSSFLLDNFNISYYTSSTAGNLADALAASSLSTWTLKNTTPVPEIAPIASVDGVEYSSITELNNALCSGTTKEVVLLRDSATKFTVDCDAKITTNGFSTYTLGSGATSVDNGNGTVTVTAEFTNALTRENFANNSITNGADYIANTIDNNITSVGTGNNTSATYFTLVKGIPASGSPFIQAYCNTTTSYTGANNNLFINASMSNSAPFTVIGDGITAYYVIDFDVMTQGDILPQFDISVPMRRNSDKAGYPFSDEIFFDGLITDKNAWSHVTIVGDVANNVTRIYVNGVYMGNGGLAVRNDQSDANKLASDTQVVAQGFRIELARNNVQTDRTLGQNVAFDNLSHRLYINGNTSLQEAINSGDITAWDSYVEGMAGEKLPAIAMVNGVAYRNTTELAPALVSNDNLEVEFGTTPILPLTLKANAVVDTNGLNFDSLLTLDATATKESVDGNYVTVSCAFIENREVRDVDYSSQTAYEKDVFFAIKGNADGNLFNRFNPVSSASWGSSWGQPGYRYGEIVTNPFTGDTFYRESAVPNPSTGKLTGTNDYVNFFFTSPTLLYESGKNEYVVIDYDFAIEGTIDSNMAFSLIPRNGGGRWGDGVKLTNFPIPHDGTMVHITAVHDFTNNKAYYFFDGELGLTVNGGAINSAGYTEYKGGATSITVTEYKLGSNSINTCNFNNMNIRWFDLATANDTIDDAIASGNIADWTDNIYDGNCAKLPALAVINGEECYTAEGLSELIIANPGVQTEILHSVEGDVNISGVASIDTHGFNFNVVETEDCVVTWDGDIVYIAASNISETVTNNTTDITNAIKYNKTGNLFSYASLSSTGDNDTISWGNAGGRGSSLITNPSTGNVYYHEYLVGDPMADYASKGNDFVNYVFTTQNLQYTAGNNEYIIVDYDLYHILNDGNILTQQVIVRNLNGGTSWAITQQLRNFNLVAGEFCHVTTVYDYTNNYAHIFVNGKLTHSVQNGANNSSKHADYLAGKTCSAYEFRVGSNTEDIINLDNLCIRYEKNAAASDTLATAINTGYITAWQNNYFTDSYEIPQNPPIATINGVETYNETTLANALTGRDKVEVSMWRSPASPLEVTTDAVIDTHGFQNVFTVGAGAAIESTVGTTTYIDAAFKESATYVAGGDGTTAGTFSDYADLSIPKNIYSATCGESNQGSFRYFKFTDYSSRNPYYMINPIADKSTGNTYISVSHATNPAITATSYFIFDIDVATETDYIDQLGITILQRSSYSIKDGGGTDFDLIADTTQVNFADYLEPSDKWAHMTLVGDIADNIIYIFVNGALVGTTAMVAESKYQSTGYSTFIQNHIDKGDFKSSGTRINMPGAVPMDQSATTLFDGISLRYYASNNAAANVEAAISAGTLNNYVLAEFGRMGENLPAIATVNGVEHGNLYKANEALFHSEDIEASLDRTSFFGNVTIASTGTVACNGITYTVELGYVASEDGGIVTLEYTKETGYVNISINGETIFEDNVRIGTNLTEVLASLGAYGTDVVAGNGNIFTNVTWTRTPEYVTGDAGYAGTGTKVETLYYAHDNGVALTGLTYNEEGLLSIMTNSTPCSIILNDSATVTSGSNIGNGKDFYLNGYSLSFSGGNHAMSAGNNARSVNFYGPGVINDMNSTNTQAFLFAGYGWTGKVTLNNLTMNASQSVFQLRGGNFEINNCEIYGNVGFDNSLFMFGEDYNGSYSTAPVNVDIVDSYVNYRVSNTRTSYPVPMFNEKVVTTSTDPAHVVNITGSTLISEYGFFRACETITGNTVENSNATFNVTDSKLVGTALADDTISGNKLGFFATINLIDNVSINSSMTNLSYANIAEGLKAVKSNDHLADVTYASEYATVTWANGVTEYWADGSIPVNETLGFVKVSEVEKGQSYTFDQVYGAAPFALSANLTLGSSISFNFYIPADTDLQSVKFNGVALTGVEKNVNSVLCYGYTVELTPAEAASAFDVVFTLADDSVVTRTFSVVQYATKLYAAYTDDATVKLMSNTLQYIKSSARYFGINADVSAIDTLLNGDEEKEGHPATTETIATTATDTSALSAYISGAQLNVMSNLKFRLNLVSGVDGNNVKVTVNGEEKAVEVYGGYVEVALRAYEMGDMMTITVNGATGTFDLATYCNYVTSNASKEDGSNARDRSYYALTNSTKGNLINAIYSYYVAASEYKN